MKTTYKHFATLLVFSLLAAPAFSQSTDKSNDLGLVFGIKGGVNFSWFKKDSKDIEKGGLKPGFSYGIMGDYNFKPNYAFAFEFLVSNLNGTAKFKDTMSYYNPKLGAAKNVSNIKYLYSNRYVQLPVSIKFRTKDISGIKYCAQFGVAPGIRISSKVKIEGQGFPWSDDDAKDIKTNSKEDEQYEPLYNVFSDDVALLNLPLMIGGGIEYNLSGNTSAYLNLRYENGFTNVLKSSSTTLFSKNLALSIGVYF